MGSSTIQWNLRPVVKYHLRRGVGFMKFLENGSRPQPPTSRPFALLSYSLLLLIICLCPSPPPLTHTYNSVELCNVLETETFEAGQEICNARYGFEPSQTTAHCNTLQHTATHCNTLKHTATYCNILRGKRFVMPGIDLNNILVTLRLKILRALAASSVYSCYTYFSCNAP